MAYLNNIPQANQRIKDSQAPIQNNFAEIQTLISVNHVDFNSGADTGKHKFIEFPVQVAAPATTLTELAMYTKNVLGVPQLFIRRQNNGAEIDFTSASLLASGYTYLPSGLLIKWGTVAFAAASSIVVNLNAVAPNYTQILSVQITPLQAAASFDTVIGLSAIGATTFTVNTYSGANTPAGYQFTYLAIGY